MRDTNDKKLLDDAREEINRIDSEMARLFFKRMRAVAIVAEYKRAEGMAVYDPERERQVIERNSAALPEDMREYYAAYQNGVMSVSRMYQERLLSAEKADK